MTTITRRNLLKNIGLGSAAMVIPGQLKAAPDKTNESTSTFEYCLNTSTISGQQSGIVSYIDIASKAGYDSIEVWIRDIEAYLNEGNSLKDLRQIIQDKGLKVASAIGFAPWMVADNAKRKAGFDQMKGEMEMVAGLGGKRIAAPASGVEQTVDLFEAGKYYKQLLDLGRSTGVKPLLEFWGASPYFFHLGQAMMVASVANDPDACLLADVYHLFRGGSGFDGLKLLSGDALELFHMNDYPDTISREKQNDSHRVYPGDGAAPLKEILTTLKQMGGPKVLSLELFNKQYWEQDPLKVAKTGLNKMKGLVNSI